MCRSLPLQLEALLDSKREKARYSSTFETRPLREYEVLAYLAHNAGAEICGCDDSVRYEIRMDGVLDEHWSSWFDGLEVTTEAVGVTVMTGPVADQAAVYGLLAEVRDLGLPLISVRRLDSESPSDGDSDATFSVKCIRFASNCR